MHEFQEIEDGALAALAVLNDQGLKTLDVYAGQLNVADLSEMIIQFPCCFVIADDLSHSSVNRYGDYSVILTVITGDRNLRGAEALTRGDAGSPGIYKLLKLARAALKDNRVAAGWVPLEFKGDGCLVYAPDESVCLYVSRYLTKRRK
jgi:phage gp37-like protein